MTSTAVQRPRTARPSPGQIGGLVVGGDYQGLGIARSLGRRGIPVVVIDDERSVAGVSRFVAHRERVADLRDPAATAATLLDVTDRLGLDGWVLYPTREETVAAVATHRDRLVARLRVPTPPLASVGAAWDKRRTYRIAESLGIAVPRCWFPTEERDLDAVDLSAPVVLKPAIKEHFFYATKAKAWRVDTADQLRSAYRKATEITGPGEIIVQELIPGGGDRQVAYCALFREGEALAEMTVVRRRQHPSDFGRASTYVETVDLPDLREPSVRFLQSIGYHGLVELEYKRDPRDGVPKLLDVNARTWGYHTLGAAAGVDFAYLLFREQLGLTLEPVLARAGVRWVRLLTDLPNAARDLLAGRLHLRPYLASLCLADTEAVFSLRDPLPGLYELALLPYLAVRRGL